MLTNCNQTLDKYFIDLNQLKKEKSTYFQLSGHFQFISSNLYFPWNNRHAAGRLSEFSLPVYALMS
jgi:hypothetical protein